MKFNVLKIIGKLRDMPDNFVVYSLSTNIIQYIGVCKLGDLIYVPDARSNTLFHICFPDNIDVTLEILYINPIRPNCINQALDLIRIHQPTMNVYGFTHNENTAPIICRETGEVFNVMEEVVRAHNISISALCNHLKNIPGHKTVKGRTYYRGKAIVVDGKLTGASPTVKTEKVSKRIQNLSTGEIFESQAAVAKHYNLKTSAVCNHLKGRLKTLKGYIFAKV